MNDAEHYTCYSGVHENYIWEPEPAIIETTIMDCNTCMHTIQTLNIKVNNYTSILDWKEGVQHAITEYMGCSHNFVSKD